MNVFWTGTSFSGPASLVVSSFEVGAVGSGESEAIPVADCKIFCFFFVFECPEGASSSIFLLLTDDILVREIKPTEAEDSTAQVEEIEKNYLLIERRPPIGRSQISKPQNYFPAQLFLQDFIRYSTSQNTANMARRRTKKRTHAGANNGPAGKAVAVNQTSRAPKSMVIRIGAGEVGPSVSQLVKDVRSMMEPGTASRLKERRSNRLKDYLTMAGPLGVSHLMLFSRSESGNTNMRLALTPRGPTLHFHVEKYSLCKDIRKALKHPKGGGKEYLNPPLVYLSMCWNETAANSYSLS